MLLYNVTIKIAHAQHADWLAWMQGVHIPEVIATGLFTEYRLCRLLGEDETEGVTYAIQYHCGSMDDFQAYQQAHALRLQKAHADRYANQYVAFRTLMEIV